MKSEQVTEHRTRVRAGIDLYKAMVQDLHDAALLEQDALKLQLCVTDLREVITTITEQLRPRFLQQECQLLLQVPEAPVWVEIDVPRIERIIMNVLLNALNSIDHDQGVVSIRLGPEAEAIVEVQDNGCGIEEKQLAVIRDRFAAIEQGEIPDSAGIGLNLCKRLINAHNGRFTLSSTPASGTTVVFSLHRASQPSHDEHDLG